MRDYFKIGINADELTCANELFDAVASVVGANDAIGVMHAVSSHDELLYEVDRLRLAIERVISTSRDLSARCASTQWGDGYRECAIDTAKALNEYITAYSRYGESS